MAKTKRYDIKTDKDSFSITAISKKDMHEYMAENNLYGSKKTFEIQISNKSHEKLEHITQLAKIELKYDDSKASKDGLIFLKSKKIEIENEKSIDSKRDEIFEAMDQSIKSKENLDKYFA